MGIISGLGSFRGQFGDHFRVGDHFGVGIISGAVQIASCLVVVLQDLGFTILNQHDDDEDVVVRQISRLI